jgi:hypothetical protein
MAAAVASAAAAAATFRGLDKRKLSVNNYRKKPLKNEDAALRRRDQECDV